MKRNQWAAILVAVLLFGCGAAVGALGHRYYTAAVVNAKTEGSKQNYISDMQSKLKLTPDQVSQLETILDETKAKYKAVRDSYHPQMMKIREEHIKLVKSILTPQQVPAYEQLVAERERHAREQDERDRQEEQRRAAEHHHVPTQ